MRIPLVVLTLLYSAASLAQGNFEKQFREVVKDAVTGFQKFRGEVKVKAETTSNGNLIEYASSIVLEQTKENSIYIIQNPDPSLNDYSYNAILSDSIAANKGRKICDEWKDKISVLVAGSTAEKYVPQSWNPGRYGWIIANDELRVSLIIMGGKDPGMNVVWLSISYTTHDRR